MMTTPADRPSRPVGLRRTARQAGERAKTRRSTAASAQPATAAADPTRQKAAEVMAVLASFGLVD